MYKEIRFMTNCAVFVPGSLPGPSTTALLWMEARDVQMKEVGFSDAFSSAGPCQDPEEKMLSGPSEESP